jgi:hypothetical protein
MRPILYQVLIQCLICFTLLQSSHAQSDCSNGIFFTGGGTFDSHDDVGGIPDNAGGQPDGKFTGNVSGSDNLVLTFPFMEAGEQICVVLGFNHTGGRASFTLNGETTVFENDAGITFYLPQEFCLPVATSGVQSLVIKDSGLGVVRIDGSIYSSCQCTSEISSGGGSLDSHQGVVRAGNADGVPDGIVTGNVSGSDYLTFTYPAVESGAQICFTLGFSSPSGKVEIDLNGSSTIYNNTKRLALYEPQKICFTVVSSGTQSVTVTESSVGNIRVDGST